MTVLVSLTILAPLFLAAAALGTRRLPRARDFFTLAGLVIAAVSSILMLNGVHSDGTHVVHVGGWSAELGIVLVADMFAALALPVALSLIGARLADPASDAVRPAFRSPCLPGSRAGDR